MLGSIPTPLDGICTLNNSLATLSEIFQCEDLQALDRVVDAKASELAVLQTFLARLITHRDEVKAQLAPVNRLPDEILRTIFEIAKDDQPEEYGLQSSVRVASVCRAWRDAALEVSCLWSSVAVYPDTEPSLTLLRTFLRRSHKQRLDIFILIPDDSMLGCPDCTEPELVDRVMPILVQHIKRWRSLHIHTHHAKSMRRALLALQKPAKCLEELTVGCNDSDPSTPLTFSLEFSAPKLWYLELSAGSFIEDVGRVSQRLAALEELELEAPSEGVCLHPFEFMSMLQPYQNLRRLSLKRWETQWTPTAQRVYLATLEEIVFEAMSFSSLSHFFDVFTAPLLAQATLSDIERESLPPDFAHLNRYPVPVINSHSFHFPSLQTVRLEQVDAHSSLHLLLPHGFSCVNLINIGPHLSEMLQSTTKLRIGFLQGYWPLERMIRLEINQRNSFPIRSLRQFVETRGRPHGASSPDDPRPPHTVRGIHVRTRTVISKKDMAWFRKRLHAFTWSDSLTEGVDDGDMGSLKIHVVPM